MKNDKTLKVRLPADELEAWTANARKASLSLSEWVRRQCSTIEPPALRTIPRPYARCESAVSPSTAKWVCKCGTKNLGTTACTKCREPMPVNDADLVF